MFIIKSHDNNSQAWARPFRLGKGQATPDYRNNARLEERCNYCFNTSLLHWRDMRSDFQYHYISRRDRWS